MEGKYKKVISKFAGNGNYQLIEHIAPCIFYVHRIFKSEKEAEIYASEHEGDVILEKEVELSFQ